MASPKRKRVFLFTVISVFFFLLPPTFAAEGTHRNYFAVDLGAYATNLDKRFSAPSGFATKVSFLSGFLRLRPGFSLGKGFFFEPSFGTLLPWETGQDGSTKTFLSHVDLTLSAPVFKFVNFRFGPGMEWLFSTSSSQTISLNNGVSQTDFFTPGRAVNTILFTVDAGLLFPLSHRLTLNLDCYVLDVASRLRRRFDGAVTLGIRL